MTEPDPQPLTNASQGFPHSGFTAAPVAALLSPTAWLAAAVPIGLGAALAAAVSLSALATRSAVVNGRLDVLGPEPAWWTIARLVAAVLLVLGVVTGVAAASHVVRDGVDRRASSARRAWLGIVRSAPLVIVVAIITAVGVGAAAIGVTVALAVVEAVGPASVVGVIVLIVLGIWFLTPLVLALPVGALADRGLSSLPHSFAVARQYSRTTGRSQLRVTFVLLLGLAAAALAISAPWGGSILAAALVTLGTTFVVVAWTVLAAGVWTGVAADGLEALGRESAEGRAPKVAGAPRRALLAAGALALAPLLTAATLTVDPFGVPAVESQQVRVPVSSPVIAPYGDGGIATLSMIGIGGHINELTLCGSEGCRSLDLPVLLTIAMSATPEGDLVFAHWRRNSGQPELVLTRLTPAELDTLTDRQETEDPGHDVNSEWIGQDEGPGSTVVIDRYDAELSDLQDLDGRSQNTTMVAVDATGSTPVIASIEAFPKIAEDQHDYDTTPTLTLYRCDDPDCTSSSTVGATGLAFMSALDGTGPTLFDVAADDDRAAVALATRATDDDPIRLFAFADGDEPTVSSFVDPLDDRRQLVGDETAGVAVALRPDGLATLLWRLPTRPILTLSSCLDEACVDWSDLEIDPGLPELPGLQTGPSAALAIDASGRPLIAIAAAPDDTLVLIDCLDAECQESQRTDLVGITWFGAPIAIAIDDDQPILIADGSWLTTPLLPAQIVRCLTSRCG
jgi:hypothetical protein